MSGCKGDTISIFVIEGWSMNEYIIYAIVLYTKNETFMKIYCININIYMENVQLFYAISTKKK